MHTIKQGGLPIYELGDTIFHISHGIGTVGAVEVKEMLGSRCRLTTIRLNNGISLMLPPQQLDKQVRDPISKGEAEELLTRLEEETPELASRFKVRKKNNQVRLASGDPYQLCELIKGLTIRAKGRPLSAIDRQQLSQATDLLSRELSHALGRDLDTIMKDLNRICGGELEAA